MATSRVLFVIFVMLILQTTVLANFTVMGVSVDLVLLVAFSAGVVAGAQRGAVIGFAAGLTHDLVLESPFGLSALIGALVGFAVGSVPSLLDRSVRWLQMLAAAGVSAAGVLAYAMVGEMLGKDYLSLDVARIALVVGLLNGLLAPLGNRVLSWAVVDDAAVAEAIG